MVGKLSVDHIIGRLQILSTAIVNISVAAFHCFSSNIYIIIWWHRNSASVLLIYSQLFTLPSFDLKVSYIYILLGYSAREALFGPSYHLVYQCPYLWQCSW